MPVKPGPVLAIYDSQSTRVLALRVVYRIDTICLIPDSTWEQGVLSSDFNQSFVQTHVQLFDDKMDLTDI